MTLSLEELETLLEIVRYYVKKHKLDPSVPGGMTSRCLLSRIYKEIEDRKERLIEK